MYRRRKASGEENTLHREEDGQVCFLFPRRKFNNHLIKLKSRSLYLSAPMKGLFHSQIKFNEECLPTTSFRYVGQSLETYVRIVLRSLRLLEKITTRVELTYYTIIA